MEMEQFFIENESQFAKIERLLGLCKLSIAEKQLLFELITSYGLDWSYIELACQKTAVIRPDIDSFDFVLITIQNWYENDLKTAKQVEEYESTHNFSETQRFPKHPGGRPTRSSQGLTKCKQYTINLPPDFYQEAQEEAYKTGLSFSRLCRLAIHEYLSNHSDNEYFK